jgi:hypothetical protein
MPWRRIEGVEVQVHALTSVLNRGEWSASCTCRFTPGLREPGTHWIGDWMGPRAGLDAVAKRKKSHHCSCRELNSGRPTRSLVTILTELPRFLTTSVEDHSPVGSTFFGPNILPSSVFSNANEQRIQKWDPTSRRLLRVGARPVPAACCSRYDGNILAFLWEQPPHGASY